MKKERKNADGFKMHKKVFNHFQTIDPILFEIAKNQKNIKNLSKSNNFFSDLCEAIINQQLSDKAARTIFLKFKKLFPKEIVTVQHLLNLSDNKIRKTGTSWRKISFMKELAEKIVKKEIILEELDKLENHQVISRLTKLKGIGQWTAEMFLMFSLGREDVFSAGDLGLKRAIQKLYHLKSEPTQKLIEKISFKWSPYRTYAALILWRSVD